MDAEKREPGRASSAIALPDPRLKGEQSLESVLAKRRSIREYTETPISLEDVSQLLWATQGVTQSDGGRTTPSAGALFPLEIYLVAGNVGGLDAGLYHYEPQKHIIVSRLEGDMRKGLSRAALRQECVRDCAALLVFTALYARTKKKYGERGRRYVDIEVGHAAQNACLQATALGLGTVPVGAFDDNAVQKMLSLSSREKVLYLLPLGDVR